MYPPPMPTWPPFPPFLPFPPFAPFAPVPPPKAPGAGKFAGKAELVAAVQMWMTDRDSAKSLYGGIDTWDVSDVKTMDHLFCADPEPKSSWRRQEECHERNQDFNDDISAWDTSKVTSMEARSAIDDVLCTPARHVAYHTSHC